MIAARMPTQSVSRILEDPGVLAVFEDGIKFAGPFWSPRGAPELPWGLDRIDQRDLPLDKTFDPMGNGGEGVHVYIVDTGSDIKNFGFNGRVGECHTVFSFDPWKPCLDDNGHGTHVASTAVDSTWGIARKATLHPVRVLQNGSGSDSDVIAGIEWVTHHVEENGWPAVANMSLGGLASWPLDMALCRSIAAGITYAVAAGNSDNAACTSSPADVTQALTAGASDRHDGEAYFSNDGPCVDIIAPGVDIPAARRGERGGPGDPLWLSGTSMASPHVAGLAALCAEIDPAPAAVRACVLELATPDKLSGMEPDTPNLLAFGGKE